ncbi:MAG: hypothetical protein LUH16_03100, partial [Clostridiales bacterium]|nr:hypothetical protein [Clostridiales bacterium]
STSYTDATAESGTTYYYTVRAVSGSVYSSYDSSVSIPCLSQPSVTLSNASTGVKVTWGAVDGAQSYRVYRKVSGGSWKQIATVSVSTLTYTDTAVVDNSGTTYYYTVRAVSGSILSSYVSDVSILYLSQPTVTLSNVSTGVKVTWGTVTGANRYRVYRKISGGSWSALCYTTSTSYTDATAESGTTYYYTVRAVSGSVYSGYLTNVSVVRLAQPTVTLSNASTGVKVTWGAVDGAQSYRVYRKVSGGSWKQIATVTTTSYTDTTAVSGTTYYYTVRAVSGSILSSYVSNKSITR